MAFPSSAIIREDKWQLVGDVGSTGQALSMQEQLFATPTAVWQMTRRVLILDSAVQEWNIWVIKQRGGLIPDHVGPVRYLAPVLVYYQDDDGFTDLTDFSDGTTFVSELGTPVPMTLVGNHAAGATSLSLNGMLAVSGLQVGMRLGVGSRLHTITGLTAGSPAYSRITAAIWPPLRAAASGGTSLDVTPVTKMRLASPDAAWIEDGKIEKFVEIDLVMSEDLSNATVLS